MNDPSLSQLKGLECLGLVEGKGEMVKKHCPLLATAVDTIFLVVSTTIQNLL